MAEITNVTSEALQAQIRRLLPSQQGFGEDLQASNVITPIIDLTSTAEGSQLGTNLQTAINFGGATTFNRIGFGSTTVVSTPGFYRIIGSATVLEGSGATRELDIRLNDGTTDKDVWGLGSTGTSYAAGFTESFDFVIFLRTGDSLIIESNSAYARSTGSVRQIADVNGNLVNPSGFSFE